MKRAKKKKRVRRPLRELTAFPEAFEFWARAAGVAAALVGMKKACPDSLRWLAALELAREEALWSAAPGARSRYIRLLVARRALEEEGSTFEVRVEREPRRKKKRKARS